MKNEPSLKTRREFLRATTLCGALSWTVPSFLAHTFSALQARAADLATQPVTGRDANILVILQMAGGNDALNTVVPFANDHYLQARPRLALSAKSVLKLNDQLGFHPSLSGFKSLYDSGQLAVIQGVGYPNPNRSHFRSTEIWQTASDANRIERYGWLGRYFDNACAGCDPTVAVNIGRQMPQAFAARKPVGVSLDNPQRYRFMAHDELAADEMETSEQAEYPAGQLANSLKLVARLIGGGLPTRVFYVSQGGYDTHTNQSGAQERLLRELGDSVKAFMEDMKVQGNLGRVLVMTFSEFGRRVQENASGGTDHGSGGLMFVAGDRVRAGLLGSYPGLAPADLLNGDLRFNTDFRSVYAGVLESWLKTPSAPILGRQFPPLLCV